MLLMTCSNFKLADRKKKKRNFQSSGNIKPSFKEFVYMSSHCTWNRKLRYSMS